MVPPSVQRIDKFDVLRRLGRGGMGSVYLARDPDIDRLVAIKLLHEGFDEEDMRGRFTAEAKSASALRHTNIVTIFQTGTFLNRPFIVMEYVSGETFADIIASGRDVPMTEKLDLLDQLLAGLQHAHAKGIIHRDIKPSNVMVDGEGVVRILDFGIARLGDGGGLTRTGVVLGTLSYMSPEQLAGKPVDARADIFSVGLVAYELLASKPAFPQAFPEVLAQISFHDPPALEELCPGIDPALIAVVGRCLAKQADDRYADCAAVRRDFHAVRQALGGADAAGAADAAPTAVRTIAASPASGPPSGGPTPSSGAIGETLVFDSRRPPTERSGAAPAPAAVDVPMTVVIPRASSTSDEKPAAVETPHAPSRSRRMVYAVAALAVLAFAAVIWRVTVSDPPSSTSSSGATGAQVSQPSPPAVVDTQDRAPAAAAAPEASVPATDPVVRQGQPVEAAPSSVDSARTSARARTSAPSPAPVRVGGAVRPPKLIRRVNPEYPSMALSARLQGTVILEATIGTNGKVTDVRVIRSIPLLDAAAAAAVRQWEYEPTILKRVAVPVITSVAVEFKLTPPAPVRVGGAIKQPTQTRRVSPVYPAEAQAAGVQGVVIIEATLGTDGKVTDVRVLQSIPLLDQAALDAVRQWEYTPTLLNDAAVPVILTVTVNFTLTPAAVPPVPPPSK